MGKFSKKMGGKEVGDASVYAAPHQGSKPMNINDVKNPQKALKPNPNWNPMDGVSVGAFDTVKTDGIKIRGTGAATKGVMARGPMG
jgi:hypothetical protein